MGANVSKQVNKAMSKNTYESTLDVLIHYRLKVRRQILMCKICI